MAKFDIGPCSCGHTFAGIEAENEEEALQMALDQAPQHIEDNHQDDPDYDKLKAMSREETAGMLRPLIRQVEAPEPAFRETLEEEEL